MSDDDHRGDDAPLSERGPQRHPDDQSQGSSHEDQGRGPADCPGGASRAATGAMADQNTPCANAQNSRLMVSIWNVGARPTADCGTAKTAGNASSRR